MEPVDPEHQWTDKQCFPCRLLTRVDRILLVCAVAMFIGVRLSFSSWRLIREWMEGRILDVMNCFLRAFS
jgi:hypothetical protein